ncbi:hypothetical protein PR048_020463 [Dryococelus australis]|uniref:Uncharacterized protein n=1 Tax=Dryococelus australis TaxID=614101 RepID=A0ABQ9H6J8_9NEOP|nr:hypothetical protein PR048_020463 [Dryococelus australis]
MKNIPRRNPQEAKAIMDELMEYFMSEEGRAPWQDRYTYRNTIFTVTGRRRGFSRNIGIMKESNQIIPEPHFPFHWKSSTAFLQSSALSMES